MLIFSRINLEVSRNVLMKDNFMYYICIVLVVVLFLSGHSFGEEPYKDNDVVFAYKDGVEQEAETQTILKEEQTVTKAERTSLANRGGRHYSVDLVARSGLSEKQIDMIVKNTGLAGLGKAYIDAEAKTGVNALFLLAISIHESDWGHSRIAIKKNNIFGFQAYTHNPSAARTFESKKESIMVVARYLKNHYLDPEGKYYKGLSVEDVNYYYADDPVWHVAVGRYMKVLLEQVLKNEGE